MILDAPTVESFERCRRKWAFQQTYEMVRVRPLGAVYRALREYLAIPLPKPGETPLEPSWARERVIQIASQRGIWTDHHDPYSIAVHHSAMAEVIARVLRQPSAEASTVHPVVKLLTGKGSIDPASWQPQSYLVDGGQRLQRFVLTGSWDDDRQLGELHSWSVLGDVCVTRLPMTLRVIVIGQARSGRRYGHWTRARQHPSNKAIRFARRTSSEGFGENWPSVWRENSRVDSQSWVQLMARDSVLSEVAFSINVKVPSEYQRAKVLEDLARIASEMERGKGKSGADFPMTRSACDDPIRGPCPWQSVCFAPMDVNVEECGLFQLRKDK
jgi:hypothetical protein